LKHENENSGTQRDDFEYELKSAIKAVLTQNSEIEDEKLDEKILEIWKNLEGKINEKKIRKKKSYTVHGLFKIKSQKTEK